MGGIFRQVACSSIAAYINMSMALLIFWPSSTLKLFLSKETVLNRPMTTTEAAFFGSLCSIGALIGNPIAGVAMDKLGRKNTSLLFASTHVIAWGIIAMFTQVEVVLTAIFIAGFGCAMATVVPVYIGEICHESIRGTLTTGAIVMYSVGMLFSFLLGGMLSYNMMVYTCLMMTTLGVTMLCLLKESPTYLMKKNMNEKATQSFAFYRNAKIDSSEVKEEMDKLTRAFDSELDSVKKPPEEKKLKEDGGEADTPMKEKVSFWSFIKRSYPTRRATYICTALVTTVIFQGLMVLEVYAKPLFEEAVPGFSPTACSVVLAVITIVCGIFTAYLTDRIGRRPLLIYASLVAFACCLILATQLQFHWGPHWVTPLFIYLFTAAFSFGGIVPFLLLTEVFAPEVKSIMAAAIIQWAWMCDSITLFMFTPLVSVLGLGSVFYIFAVAGILTSVISFRYLPETQGVPVDEMEGLFSKGRALRK